MRLNFIKFIGLVFSCLVLTALLLSIFNLSPRFPIFPESGLSKSLYVPVFIGLIIMTLFTETLGWNYSGLVVPGYLTPLILIKPWSFWLVCFEALATYFVVRGFARLPARVGYWSAFFGRDRFFLILAVSIGIRVLLEGWGIDFIAAQLLQHFGMEIQFRSQLYSIGLIVVPLMANMFWNSGFRKGILPVTLSVFLTYITVRFLVVPLTNYSISNIELAYENLAMDFVFTSKAYLLLIVTAYMASWANLKYGWDFSGILIPSLLALAWMEPTKIVTTVIEASAILFISRFITQRKFMMKLTIEGPRKILLLFFIGFMMKWVMGFANSATGLGYKASDFYGFGFLLPALIASKMWQKNSFSQIMGPVLRVSLAGLLVGNLLGFTLYMTNRDVVMDIFSPRVEKVEPRFDRPADQIVRELILDKAFVKRCSRVEAPARADKKVRALLSEVVGALLRLETNPDQTRLRALLRDRQTALLELDFEYTIFLDKDRPTYVVLQNKTPELSRLQGWGAVAINLQTSSRLVLEVPYPLSESASLETAAVLFERTGARMMIVAGSDPVRSYGASADVLENPELPYWSWRKLADAMDLVQIRNGETTGSKNATLTVAGTLAEDLPIDQVKALCGDIELRFDTSGKFFANGNPATGTFAQLRLPISQSDGIWHAISEIPAVEAQREQSLQEYLEGIWEGNPDMPAAAQRHWRLRTPDLREKTAFSTELISHLLSYARAAENHRIRTKKARATAYCNVLDLRITEFRDNRNGQEYLIVSDSGKNTRLWGAFIFRQGAALPVAVEVPRPVMEIGTLDIGFWLFEQFHARALFWPGVRFASSSIELTDALSDAARDMPFNLAHQDLQLSNESSGAGLSTIQVRGFSEMDHPDQSDVVASFGPEISSTLQLSPFQKDLISLLAARGLRTDIFDGSTEMVDFGVYSNAQYAFSSRCCGDRFVTLWFPRGIRRTLSQITTEDFVEQICRHRQLPEIGKDAGAYVTGRAASLQPIGPLQDRGALFAATSEALLRYQAFRNPNEVTALLERWQNSGFSVSCAKDMAQDRTLFLMEKADAMALINPNSLSDVIHDIRSDSKRFDDRLRSILEDRSVVLMITGKGKK